MRESVIHLINLNSFLVCVTSFETMSKKQNSLTWQEFSYKHSIIANTATSLKTLWCESVVKQHLSLVKCHESFNIKPTVCTFEDDESQEMKKYRNLENKEIIFTSFFQKEKKLDSWVPRKLLITSNFQKLSNRSFVAVTSSNSQ